MNGTTLARPGTGRHRFISPGTFVTINGHDWKLKGRGGVVTAATAGPLIYVRLTGHKTKIPVLRSSVEEM